MLGFAPSRPAPLVAPIISVDLIAALPGETPPVAPASSAQPEAAPKPIAKPPPPPRPKKIVLPKEAQSARRTPRKADRPPKRAKPQERDLDEFLKELRQEAGETAPPQEVAKADPVPSTPPSSPAQGIRVNPEVAKFLLAVDRHVRTLWVTPPEFLDRDLETRLLVDLAADGRVLGEPRVVKPSGDPFWDDSAIRAVLRASPLPPPPGAGDGEWTLSFPSRTYP